MGACQRRFSCSLLLSYTQYTVKNFNMVDNVETTTPTVEEVAANGESKTATEEVKEAVAAENGTNGVHKKEENGEAKEAEATPETTTSEAEAVAEETKEESAEEATKRKADEPSEDETSEKIAKLKETAADVVAEEEKKLPEEPLTEAEATA